MFTVLYTIYIYTLYSVLHRLYSKKFIVHCILCIRCTVYSLHKKFQVVSRTVIYPDVSWVNVVCSWFLPCLPISSSLAMVQASRRSQHITVQSRDPGPQSRHCYAIQPWKTDTLENNIDPATDVHVYVVVYS